MPNSAGVEVARISVKVSPDTSKFYEDLKKKLKAIEKALGKEDIDAGDIDVGTEKAEKKVSASTKRMSKNKVKLGVEANKIDTAAISKDIGKSLSALDKFAGKFDVKNGLFWDPKEGQEATQVAIDNFKMLQDESDKLAAAEKKRLAAITTKTKKLAEASKKASDAAKFDINTTKFKIKPTDIGKSIEALDKSSGKIVLWEEKEAEKLAESVGKAVPGIQKKLDTLDLKWDKKMRDFNLAPTLGAFDKNGDLRADLANNVREMDRLIEKANEAHEATDRLFFSTSKRNIRAAFKDYIDGVREISVETKKSKKNGGLDLDIGGTASKGFNLSKLMPNFGSGINPAGYVAILGALALVAAPLVGLVSTLVLAIPGMISAIVTPMMAIGLGMDGIKRAGANSGLFKYDDEGKLEGLGAVFDKVKTNVSAAFDEGLTPALKTLAGAIDPLLGSLPKVATGLTDMFQGFIDSLTSTEGMALFDDTIKNIGAAMSAAAPGIKSFTDGMLGIANSFSLQLPKFSGWLNTTGDSFAKWVTEMTTVPDPAGHHGPNPNGQTPMDLAFEGLGGTLKTIGDWVVDMGQAGLKFVQDPKKMQDFLGTLDSIGQAITKLIDLGNKLGPIWALANGDDFGNAPGVQNLPKPKETEAAVQAARAAAEEANRVKGVEPTPQAEESWLSKIGGMLTKGLESWMAPPGTRVVGDSVVKTNIAPNELAENVKGQIDALNERIAGMEADMSARVADGKSAVDPILGDYKVRVEDLKDDLAELKAIEASLSPQVALKSFETPLGAAEGGKPSFVQQMITDLKAVPAAAVPATDALQAVKDTGVMTPEALGQLSQNAQTAPVPAAPVAPVEPQKIPAPDTSAFDAAIQELPTSTTTAMQAVADAVTTGGQTAAGNMLIVGQQMVANIQTFTGLFQTAGQQMMMGLANGITVGTAWVVAAARSAAKAAYDSAKAELDINSPSKKFIEIGLSTMEGMSKGMDGGIKPVIDKATDLADKVSAAFADGTADPTALLAGMSNKEINQMEKVLGYQQESLNAQISGMSYRNRKIKDPGVEAEIQKLKDMETELGLQKKMIDLAQDFSGIDDKNSGEDPFVKAASGLMNSPVDFAKATGKQFMSDLGIGGNGLIGNAITEGISYIFNIASVDEALSLKDREDNKAMQSGLGR